MPSKELGPGLGLIFFRMAKGGRTGEGIFSFCFPLPRSHLHKLGRGNPRPVISPLSGYGVEQNVEGLHLLSGPSWHLPCLLCVCPATSGLKRDREPLTLKLSFSSEPTELRLIFETGQMPLPPCSIPSFLCWPAVTSTDPKHFGPWLPFLSISS